MCSKTPFVEFRVSKQHRQQQVGQQPDCSVGSCRLEPMRIDPRSIIMPPVSDRWFLTYWNVTGRSMVKIRIKVDDDLLEQFRKAAAAHYGDSEDFLGKAITEAMRQRVEEVERTRAALKNQPT